MPNSRVSELSSKRNKLIADAQVLVNEGKAASEDYRSKIAEIDSLQEEVDALNKLERSMGAAGLHTPKPVPVVLTNTSEDFASLNPEQRKRRLNAAYRSLFLNGHGHQVYKEQRDLTVTSDGTPTIAQEFDSQWTAALRNVAPIAGLVRRVPRTTGAPRKFVTYDDTGSTMNYLPETGAIEALEEDPIIASRVPSTDTLVSFIKYSLNEAEDAEDFGKFISDLAASRVAIATEYALLKGKDNGTNTQLANSPTGGILGAVSTGATTASLAAGIGYQDLVNLSSSVDHAYYRNGVYLASQSVHDYMLGQKDAMGRPYYLVDPSTGLLMVNGKPLHVASNAAMPAYNAANSPVVLFGDFSRYLAYIDRGVRIQILTERFSPDSLEAGAVIHTRIGATILVTSAVKALYTAAS